MIFLFGKFFLHLVFDIHQNCTLLPFYAFSYPKLNNNINGGLSKMKSNNNATKNTNGKIIILY